MVAFMSVVRFKVRPEQTEEFVSTWSNGPPAPGRVSLRLIQAGDCQFCGVSEWESEDAIAAARPDLIKFLDTIRPMLEEISPVLGVTDPVSGPVVAERSDRKNGVYQGIPRLINCG